MKKKILALALALSALAAGVSAEQPKAEEYRQILSSGTYFIEYENLVWNDPNFSVAEAQHEFGSGVPVRLAVADGNRMRNGRGMASKRGFLGGLMGAMNRTDSYLPDAAMYKDGKYYIFQFYEQKALVVNEEELDSGNLNGEEGWADVRQRLALPEELIVFAPDEPFNEYTGYQVPEFKESGQTIEKKDVLDYDVYSIVKKTKGGTILYEKQFWFYYKKGELRKVRVYTQNQGEEKVLVSAVKVNVITQKLPKGAIELPKNCKVYAAGNGSMSELLNEKELVERTPGEKSGFHIGLLGI